MNKNAARIAGVLFLLAMVTSIVGGGMIDEIIGKEDYLTSIYDNKTTLYIGILMEFINAISVIGIAAFLFSALKKYNERLAVAYVGIRVVESVACIVAAMIPLSVLALNEQFVSNGLVDEGLYEILGNLVNQLRADVMAVWLPIFFSLGALVLYYVAYKSKLFPRYISIWGIIGALGIIILNYSGIESSLAMLLALPIITNEIFLGFWLIIKGFNNKVIKKAF